MQAISTRAMFAAAIAAGLVFTAPVQAEHRNDTYRAPVKLAVVAQRDPHGAHDIARYLAHYLPRGVALVGGPRGADFVLEVYGRSYDARIRPHQRYERSQGRYAWTEVSAYGVARYNYSVVLRRTDGRLIDRDRIRGEVEEHLTWGEDLRVRDRHGWRPAYGAPPAPIAALFARGRGGYGARVDLSHQVAEEVAQQISRATLPRWLTVYRTGDRWRDDGRWRNDRYGDRRHGEGFDDDGWRQDRWRRVQPH